MFYENNGSVHVSLCRMHNISVIL